MGNHPNVITHDSVLFHLLLYKGSEGHTISAVGHNVLKMAKTHGAMSFGHFEYNMDKVEIKTMHYYTIIEVRLIGERRTF